MKETHLRSLLDLNVSMLQQDSIPARRTRNWASQRCAKRTRPSRHDQTRLTTIEPSWPFPSCVKYRPCNHNCVPIGSFPRLPIFSVVISRGRCFLSINFLNHELPSEAEKIPSDLSRGIFIKLRKVTSD